MATMAENVIAAGSETQITVKDTYGVTDIRRPQRLEDLDGQDKFTSKPVELIHSYYLRFTKLINDMKMIPMTMSPMQINTKFMNLLQPKWSRFVTTAKQANDLHRVTFDQFYAPTVVQQPPTYQPDTGLAIPTFLPSDDPIESLNKAMIFLSSLYHSKFPPMINQLQTSSNPRTQATIQNGQVTVQNVQGANQPRVIRCYNCNGEGRMAKQCTARKKVKDSEWFKEKMLLAQAQEAGVVLNDDQHDFLADKCDDEATAYAIFMANFSPVGCLNDDTVEPCYDSDILFDRGGPTLTI
ncbi:retrovirus-related pol polyprotein from transposon TNT 1-94 [Tanacetum coccineum]